MVHRARNGENWGRVEILRVWEKEGVLGCRVGKGELLKDIGQRKQNKSLASAGVNLFATTSKTESPNFRL
jgi:hypothetical protein